MISVPQFGGQRVAVFGLGASGLSAARALRAGGAQVVAWDDREEGRKAAQGEGFSLDDLTQRSWDDIAALVLAPGVPLTHPRPHRVVQLARLANAPIIGDMELFALALAATPEARRPHVIAITGTNGKSTTTALIGHVVKSCGRDAQIGGNIGTPALDLEPFHAGAIYVLEVSSFQLDLVRSFAPDVAVLLNVAPDHLDRHGGMSGYIAAKSRIFEHQVPGQYGVVCLDDEHAASVAMRLRARRVGPGVVFASARKVLPNGVYVAGGTLYDGVRARARPVTDLRHAPALLGQHNWQNAAAAYAATRCLGLEVPGIAAALGSFAGLAHRMEPLGTVDGIRFVNDSKATNPDAARQALGAFDDIFWIGGGRAKDGGFSALDGALGAVRQGYLIGEAAEAMAAELSGQARMEICRDLDTAVRAAVRDARKSGAKDPVVVFSPACASFDQFANFVARGEAFRKIVAELAGAGRDAGRDAGDAHAGDAHTGGASS